jgi:DnaK suppressor protein
MRYLTIEQREALQHALERRGAQLRGEVREDLQADLNAEPEVAALERDAVELQQVEAALARLHQPGFGLCLDCKAEIPYVRLQASPIAIRCLGCEQAHERRHA